MYSPYDALVSISADTSLKPITRNFARDLRRRIDVCANSIMALSEAERDTSKLYEDLYRLEKTAWDFIEAL